MLRETISGVGRKADPEIVGGGWTSCPAPSSLYFKRIIMMRLITGLPVLAKSTFNNLIQATFEN
jgi:hypothetical protein